MKGNGKIGLLNNSSGDFVPYNQNATFCHFLFLFPVFYFLYFFFSSSHLTISVFYKSMDSYLWHFGNYFYFYVHNYLFAMHLCVRTTGIY